MIDINPKDKEKPFNVDINRAVSFLFLFLFVSTLDKLTVANICREPHIYKNANKRGIHYS